MQPAEEIRRLESDLLHEKEDLRKDIIKINNKLKAARDNFSPVRIVKSRLILLSGLTMGLGFALGYRDVPIEEIGRPVVLGILASAGKQAAIHAIRGI
ncbi:MAG: hypothetical protein C5B58_05230 [Acidobacteria bacterium]|nr:MAG: hypothetical protein C5B58_05230 [Acidobacteriota bacterium]